MTQEPAWALDAADLVVAYRAGQLDPVTVLDACLDRIEATNPTLNAIVTLDIAGARAAAEASAKRWREGAARGPVAGIPLTVKAHLFVAGRRATWGSRRLGNQRAPRG
ncbi:MAG: amidase family protein, partial [bacterium]